MTATATAQRSHRRPETTAPGLAVEVRHLVKTYPGGVRALDGLSFAVEAGTVFGLLGPNGAGKSTTVKVLTTLSRPDDGEAWVAGHSVLDEPHAVRRVIGCVAQRSGVDPTATGRENLTLQGHLYGMGGRALRDRVADLIERFRLSDVADRLVQTYSGGMQRKLDLAMGLVHRPRVLFLDEPTTGLDPEARADLWEEIARLTREDGVTILLTTHYLDEADRLAQRLAIVDRGRVVIEGSPEQLKGELHGDTVHIELERRAANAQASAVVQQVGLTDVVVDGRWLRARASHGASALPAVLAALEAHGVRAISATVARPSLDDVYLRYAGRRFDQANQEDVR